MTLNPVLTIGTQMVETLKAHRTISEAEARERSLAKLREVAILSPEARLASYPHELSGGLRQRIVIAIALLTEPDIIIADEPTTALDVTIQAEVMALLLELCMDHGVGLILITHDLAVVAQATRRLIVMYAGRIVEEGRTDLIIDDPRHPYTRGLINALPQRRAAGARLSQIRGTMPSLGETLAGCAFSPRCDLAIAECAAGVPALRPVAGRSVACVRAEASL